MVTEAPFAIVTVPPEIIPVKKQGESFDRFESRLAGVCEYMAWLLPEGHPFRETAASDIYSDGTSPGFRGLVRYKDFQKPYQPTKPFSTLEATLKSIEEQGHEKPNSNKIWFTRNLQEALFFSLPQTPDELGIIIISNKNGMTANNEYPDFGDDLKPGYTWKELHLGTIIYAIEESSAPSLYKLQSPQLATV